MWPALVGICSSRRTCIAGRCGAICAVRCARRSRPVGSAPGHGCRRHGAWRPTCRSRAGSWRTPTTSWRRRATLPSDRARPRSSSTSPGRRTTTKRRRANGDDRSGRSTSSRPPRTSSSSRGERGFGPWSGSSATAPMRSSTTATIPAGSSCVWPCASTWPAFAVCARASIGSSSPEVSPRRSISCRASCAPGA